MGNRSPLEASYWCGPFPSWLAPPLRPGATAPGRDFSMPAFCDPDLGSVRALNYDESERNLNDVAYGANAEPQNSLLELRKQIT